MSFVVIPDTVLPDGTTVKAFEVSQYLCALNAEGLLCSDAEAVPVTGLNFYQAQALCEQSGFHLITERQWLAIAWNIARCDTNWSGGAVCAGHLAQGVRHGIVKKGIPASFPSLDASEKRWLKLSTEDEICDMNGNLFAWVFDDVQGNGEGLIDKPFNAHSVSLTAPALPSTQGTGWRPSISLTSWKGRALLRGGCWESQNNAGLFYLSNGNPKTAYQTVGIRCTRPCTR